MTIAVKYGWVNGDSTFTKTMVDEIRESEKERGREGGERAKKGENEALN